MLTRNQIRSLVNEHGHDIIVHDHMQHIERDSIACHMFPMTLKPPSYIEGYLVTMADKISATRETFSLERFSKPQLESGKPLAAIESGATAASAHDGRHKPSRSREVLA